MPKCLKTQSGMERAAIDHETLGFHPLILEFSDQITGNEKLVFEMFALCQLG
jgi:hypothetical protein